MMRLLTVFFISLYVFCSSSFLFQGNPEPQIGDCTFNGHKLYGRIQLVEAFPDVKVQIVNSNPNLYVHIVDAFPEHCGEWQIVNSFPDTRIQIVSAFPDLKVQILH